MITTKNLVSYFRLGQSNQNIFKIFQGQGYKLLVATLLFSIIYNNWMSSKKTNDQSAKKNDFIKEMIESVSERGSYQKKIIIFFLVTFYFSSLMSYCTGFYFMNPVFTCSGHQGKVTEDNACRILNQCTIINSNTITAQLKLYCDSRKEERIFIQTSMGIGNIAGIIFGGLLSDKTGRKFCFCIGLLLSNLTSICQIIGVIYNQFILLSIAQAISGFTIKLISMNFLVLLTRFVSERENEIANIAWLLINYGLVTVTTAAISRYASSWLIMFYISSIGVFICSILSFFILKEDPIYLFDSRRINEALEVIDSVGVENGVSQQKRRQITSKLQDYYKLFLVELSKQQKEAGQFNISQILNCQTISKILIIGSMGCFYSMIAKTIQFSIQDMQFSYEFNLLVLGLGQIVGFFTAVYITYLIPTKKQGFLLTSFAFGILAILLIFPFSYQNGLVQSSLVFVLDVLLCWICNYYIRFKVDLFPKRYQVTCMSVVYLLGNFGQIAGPSVIQLAIDRSINPIFFVNIFRMTLGTLPLLFLKQTQLEEQKVVK